MSNHLKPCPFCGGNASFNDHTDGCYFTVLSKLKADPPADLSRVHDLIEAWNTRTAIQQAESEPVAWMASYVDPIGNDHVYVTSHHDLAVENDMHGTPRPLYTHPAPGVPDGWKLVPIEPTEEMLLAYTGGAITNAGFRWCRHQWSAMLAASHAQKVKV